ncbi:MAG: hypothetical protein GXZ15_03840 [Campylobacter sp.]|nr:hypothetical protein [Campylobacter sp.]
MKEILPLDRKMLVFTNKFSDTLLQTLKKKYKNKSLYLSFNIGFEKDILEIPNNSIKFLLLEFNKKHSQIKTSILSNKTILFTYILWVNFLYLKISANIIKVRKDEYV